MLVSALARALSRSSATALIVFGIAAIVRLPHYDVAWFGLDPIQFIAEARRILAGHWHVAGPKASGLDIIGPLYSYLLAGVLWVRDTPSDIALLAALVEVAAAWLVFDCGRRLSGLAGGFLAAVSYIAAPILTVGTRVIWNPSLLPAVAALAWWLAVRHVQSASTGKLAAIAFSAGLMLTLHATAVFQVAALAIVVVLSHRLSLRQVFTAVAAGLVPLLPVLPRLFGETNAGALLDRIAAPSDAVASVRGLIDLTLGFPRLLPHWSGIGASAGLYLQAALAAVGLASGLMARTLQWPIWIGVTVAFAGQVAGALFYTSPIAWHHFIALVPLLSLCVGHSLTALHRGRVAVAAACALACGLQLLFVYHFDRLALAAGWIRVNTQWVALHAPQGTGYALHLRELQAIGNALRDELPDGAATSATGHGARAELWRETGGPFVPAAVPPRARSRSEFVLMGSGATVESLGARLVGDRVCVFEHGDKTIWRARHEPAPVGWELPAFPDQDWASLRLPARAAAPGGVPSAALVTWPSPQLLLRGRIVSDRPRRRLLSVAIRSSGGRQEVQAALNGTPITASRERTLGGFLGQTREWLFDVTSLRAGENTLAIAVTAEQPHFELDVFELPCFDADWYR